MLGRNLVTLSAAALVWCALAPARAQERKGGGGKEAKRAEEISRHTSRSTWINQDDKRIVKVTVEDKVVLNDDFTDAADIPSDGSLEVEDNRDGTARRYRVVRGAGGGLERTYWVNGGLRALDAEGREWVRRVMLEASRQGGLFARQRAQRILKERGARGLAEELTHVRGDYARRIYFEELVASGRLDDSALASALQSLRIASDYERAQFLIRAAEVALPRERVVPAYFEAVGQIGSDYEHRRVLSAVLKREGLGREAQLAALRSAARIGSDYEKATFLVQFARLGVTDERVRAAFADAARTIGSDYERGRVEKAAARRPAN